MLAYLTCDHRLCQPLQTTDQLLPRPQQTVCRRRRRPHADVDAVADPVAGGFHPQPVLQLYEVTRQRSQLLRSISLVVVLHEASQ